MKRSRVSHQVVDDLCTTRARCNRPISRNRFTIRSVRTASEREYAELIRGATALSQDGEVVKVWLLRDGRIIKLFRRKRLISSALWRPYALRFAHAAARLDALGIATVNVHEIVRLPHISRHGVIYDSLEGTPLRDALATGGATACSLWTAFAAFLAMLHKRGVYFRAIHLANVIVSSGDSFGLIDVSETRFFHQPLRPMLRARNFKPLLKYEQDINAMRSFGFDRFLDLYLEDARLSGRDQTRFLKATGRLHPGP